MKKMNYRYSFLLLLSFLATSTLFAQGSDELPVIARAAGDSVQLRWAPNSSRLWRDIRESGLTISRQTMTRDGKLLPAAERQIVPVTEAPIFPEAMDAFERVGAVDDYVAIGGQAIYGESFVPDAGEAEYGGLGGMMNRATEEQNRYTFGLYAADHSWTAANMLGLAFTDRTVKANEGYLYRIRPSLFTLSQLDTLNSAFIAVEAGIIEENLKIPNVNVEWKDKSVTLSWNLEGSSRRYSSYFIERSEDAANWERINEQPFVPLITTDFDPTAYYQAELPENNRPYFLRVGGRTPFGVEGPMSDPVVGMGKDPIPAQAASIAGAFPTEEGGFDIMWTFPTDTPINGFRVKRSNRVRGEYEYLSELLADDVRSFRDVAPMPSNYYQVVVFDQYDRELSSFPMLAQPDDDTPPAIPTNLRGVILDDGKIILNWDANTEPDLLGYRIWMGNRPEDEFTLMTGKPITNNFYVDSTTLETLTPNLYAKITSLDIRHNRSDYSEYITLVRPDTIPPAAPLIYNVEATEQQLEVMFHTSRTPDIARHELYRREVDGGEWELLKTYPFPEEKEVGNHIDTELLPGKLHEYRLDAVDHAELRASSKVLNGQILDDFIRDPVKKVNANADRVDQKIDLEWNYRPERDNFDYFEIYRGIAEKPVRVITRQNANTGTIRGNKMLFGFSDEGPLKMNTTYTYQVRAVYKDGAMSALSPAVQVDY